MGKNLKVISQDHELRPLLAAQDGLSHVLNEPLEKPAKCVVRALFNLLVPPLPYVGGGGSSGVRL